MFNESDQYVKNALIQIFRSEINVIRCYREFIKALPLHGSSIYQAGSNLLLNRLQHDNFTQAIDAAFSVSNRPGSLLVPRIKGREITWAQFIGALVNEDSNFLPDYDPDSTDESIYYKGEKVTFLNGEMGSFDPNQVKKYRTFIMNAQNDYLMNVNFAARLFPEFISIYFGLKPETVSEFQDIGVSSLSLLQDCVLFPRVIHFKSEPSEESLATPVKASAWAYEVLADVKLGYLNADLMELLRYDTRFANNRQDIFTLLCDSQSMRD